MYRVGKSSRNNIKSFINIILYNGPIKKRFRAQLDSGNTLSQGVAVSRNVLTSMRQITVGPQSQVRTAQKGATMKSYGTSLPLLMSIEGHRDKFEIRPTVIDNLSGQVNIGSAFFTELSKGGARVSLSYINGKPALEIKGRRTEMIQTVAESSPDEVERSSSKIFQQPCILISLLS